jgi:uncharacterized protein YjeT (DUF2065 family)
MPDVHVPDIGARHGRGRSLLKIALEVLLIATGVFLGLAGEQWREHARHRDMAAEALRRFRAEVAVNRKAVADVKDYHEDAANQRRTGPGVAACVLRAYSVGSCVGDAVAG